MKSLIFSFLATAFLLCPFNFSPKIETSERVIFYNVSGIEIERQATVRKALEYMDKSLDCVRFEEYQGQKINKNMVLHYVSVDHFAGKIVGLYSERGDRPMVLVAEKRKTREGTLYRMPEDFFYKVILHETGHVLGMRDEKNPKNPHPFPPEEALRSQLSPQLSDTTPKQLFDRDIEYLNDLTCGSND